MNINEIVKNIKFDDKGLVVCIAQDVYTGAVLMQAYMNEESLRITLDTKEVTYFSRSRQSLWKKGETSGHFQHLKSLSYDCDGDSILVKVEQIGNACHTGSYSCFFNEVQKTEYSHTLSQLYDKIKGRKENPIEGSYTNYLFDKGINKILKKVGEECSEVIIASKDNDFKETVYEIGDLVYHTLVLMVNQGVTTTDILKELSRRDK